MTDDLWYPMGGLPAHGRVLVWLFWAGRVFKAARIFDERGKKKGLRPLVWATVKDGEPVQYLPPPGQEEEWGPEPTAFRPIYKERWDWPLPTPLETAAPQFVAERTRFQLVEEAEASDLAHEMEADRAHANAVSRHVSRGTPAIEVQWWRDFDGLKYEQAPDISLKNAEWRLMRAIYNCGHDEHDERGAGVMRAVTSALADVMRELAENELHRSPDIIPRMKPAPRDEDDFLTAMSWFAALYPPEARPDPRFVGLWRFSRAQRVLILRALNTPKSFDEIGGELFGKHEKRSKQFETAGKRAQNLFKEAIEDCWRFANGMPNRKGVAARVDHVARLRETNRRAKREARA
jgi:hypothetical protein